MAPAHGIWVPKCEGRQAFTSKMGAAELTRMVQAFAKIIETAEIEERIRKQEEATHK